MSNKRLPTLLIVAALLGGGYWLWHSHHNGGKPAQDAEKAAPDSTKIGQEMADQSNIVSEQAAAATIHETVTLTGRITLNPNTTAQVKARFPGIVREVRKGISETVNSGDILAMVESNDSLQIYPVKAPISGIILARNTNIGDVAADAPLFTIANLSDVWAEFHVFPHDLARIKAGQKVRIKSTDGSIAADAAIQSLLPVAEAVSQTVIARATLANPEGQWRSGMTVRGDVVLSEREVPVAVASTAIQRLEGATVVFVQEGQTYTARKVELGISDDRYTEIKSGLKVGERYVAQNSFTVKADIGKSGEEEE